MVSNCFCLLPPAPPAHVDDFVFNYWAVWLHVNVFGGPRASKILAAARFLVYTVGFLRLLYWHISQTFIAYRSKAQPLVFAILAGQCSGKFDRTQVMQDLPGQLVIRGR